ncbi:MAG: YaeQ family protein, partial [Pseudomonadota bacterium]|nr:YaeQ family protein [Pseudomonadota bacterium]
MALSATIYKAKLNVSDLDRHYYCDHALTVACHPSETATRLMVRLLAFIANAHATSGDNDLAMTRGLSTDDEPDLWLKAPDGRILSWIELGEPS